jgi:hypothetical protein
MVEAVVERIASEQADIREDVALYRIVAFPADYTLQVLYEKFKSGEIVVQRFQRRFVWKRPRASKLIESFLLQLPVPGVFFYRREDNPELVVIDGQQRLRSVFGFIDGSLPQDPNPFFLEDVQARWSGKTYNTLNHSDQIRLRDSVLRATIITQIDPEDDSSIYEIFNRLNTGGVSLTPQEIRNCIHHGRFNDLLIKLNELPSWRQIFGRMELDDRMRDVELILRAIALTLDEGNYEKPMKNFLNRFAAKGNRYPDSELARFAETFRAASDKVVKTLGVKPFNIRSGVNAAVCDSVMVAFMRHSGSPQDIWNRYSNKLITNKDYLTDVSAGTTDADNVHKRIRLAEALLFGAE